MKGVVLVAGKGQRMKAYSCHKCLLAVNNKSLIIHNLERLSFMGIDEIIIVVGTDGKEIKKHVETNFNGTKISFVEQKMQLGIVDAIKCAGNAIGNDDFVLCLGDEIFVNQKPKEMLQYFQNSGADCVCGIISNESEEEIKKCFSVLIDRNDNILDLTEKPEKTFNQLKGTGFGIYRNKMLNFLDIVKPNEKSGQYELCDWIKICINQGMVCKAFIFAQKEYNVNTIEDLQLAKEKFESN